MFNVLDSFFSGVGEILNQISIESLKMEFSLLMEEGMGARLIWLGESIETKVFGLLILNILSDFQCGLDLSSQN